jgi:hypothetical protein
VNPQGWAQGSKVLRNFLRVDWSSEGQSAHTPTTSPSRRDTRLETTCRVETCRFLTGKNRSKSFLHNIKLLNPTPVLYGLAFFDETSAVIDTSRWGKLQARTAIRDGKDIVLELKQLPRLPNGVKLSAREALSPEEVPQ